MCDISYNIRQEIVSDFNRITELHSEALGPGQFAKTAYRIREGYSCDSRLCFVVQGEKEILASVRFTPIHLGQIPGQLLGPLAVKPKYKNQGIGKSLLKHSLSEAKKINETQILLVGDESYYGVFGFQKVKHGTLKLPGPVDPERLLIAYLDKKFIDSKEVTGTVRGRLIGI